MADDDEYKITCVKGLKSHLEYMSAGARLAIFTVIGAVFGIAVGIFASWNYTPLVIWDIAAALFVSTIWTSFIGSDAERTKAIAMRLDPSRAVSDTVLIISSIISLVAVGILLSQAGKSNQGIIPVALSALSVIISWAVIHTVYLLRYATRYYKNGGGVEFKGTRTPSFSDFAYLTMMIGMTFQVSDTDLQSSEFRSLTVAHALLSFIFGTVILASIVNLISNLGTSS